MAGSGFTKFMLSQMRLSQLRELARRTGVLRYSNMLRDQLIAAIHARPPLADSGAFAQQESGLSLDVPPTPSEAVPTSAIPITVPPTVVAQSAPLPFVEAPTPRPSAEVVPSVVASTKSTITATESPATASAAPSPSFVGVYSSTEKPAASESLPSAGPISAVNHPTWVALIPRDPQWAIVSWEISTADRDQALLAGGRELALRLTDVTDAPDQDGRPHTLQEVLVDGTAQEWHLPVPLGDRDYRVELGYRLPAGGWYSLARSGSTRIVAETDLTLEPFVPFAMVGLDDRSSGVPSMPLPGLHERIYQQVSVARRRISQGSEGFHQQSWEAGAGAGAGGQDSGAGPWASGREASGAGMPTRQRSFWLVADAELIVYGATDPAATVIVGNEVTPLTEEGTFQFHTAFPDGEQNYPIRAIAADGEQQRSITIDFKRSTPHAKVNSKESATAEWF